MPPPELYADGQVETEIGTALQAMNEGWGAHLLAHTRSHTPLRAYRRRGTFRLDDVVLAFYSRSLPDPIGRGEEHRLEGPVARGLLHFEGRQPRLLGFQCVPCPPRLSR